MPAKKTYLLVDENGVSLETQLTGINAHKASKEIPIDKWPANDSKCHIFRLQQISDGDEKNKIFEVKCKKGYKFYELITAEGVSLHGRYSGFNPNQAARKIKAKHWPEGTLVHTFYLRQTTPGKTHNNVYVYEVKRIPTVPDEKIKKRMQTDNLTVIYKKQAKRKMIIDPAKQITT